jgi:hypothetical protein
MDYRKVVTIKILERMLRKIVRQENGCWLWAGSKWPDGYGRVYLNQIAKPAHKVLYELVNGVIPEGLVTDHICHTKDNSCKGGKQCLHRQCVNPAHIEPVTNKENVLRGNGLSALNAQKTVCKRGHEFAPQTDFYKKINQRRCNQCTNLMAGIRLGRISHAA